MLKKTVFALTLMFAFTLAVQAQTIEDKIVGEWSTEDGDNSIVNFYKAEDGLWYGKIISTDVRRSIGKLLFIEGAYDADDDAIVGTIVIPDKEWHINTKITLESINKLKVVGSKLFLSKTFYWLRG